MSWFSKKEETEQSAYSYEVEEVGGQSAQYCRACNSTHDADGICAQHAQQFRKTIHTLEKRAGTRRDMYALNSEETEEFFSEFKQSEAYQKYRAIKDGTYRERYGDR